MDSTTPLCWATVEEICEELSRRMEFVLLSKPSRRTCYGGLASNLPPIDAATLCNHATEYICETHDHPNWLRF